MSPPDASPAPRRVLYADDDRALADSSVAILKIRGFEALACYDGPSALRLAEEFTPAVCFLDLNMPGLNGDEVAARLRSAAGCPRLVAVTGVGDEERGRRLAGFDLHFVKPADPVHLLAAAREFCRLRQGDC